MSEDEKSNLIDLAFEIIRTKNCIVEVSNSGKKLELMAKSSENYFCVNLKNEKTNADIGSISFVPTIASGYKVTLVLEKVDE